MSTYTGRSTRFDRVAQREQSDQGCFITGESGWSVGCSREVHDLLPVGKGFVLETRNFSQVTGWLIDGEWHDRKSDEQLQAEHAAWLADIQRAADGNRWKPTARTGGAARTPCPDGSAPGWRTSTPTAGRSSPSTAGATS